MSDILITIGITCFNAEDTIERAISGALSQSWKNIEILVVDDASTDSSRKKVQRFNKKDDRVKLLKRNVNGGPAAARNTILKAS